MHVEVCPPVFSQKRQRSALTLPTCPGDGSPLFPSYLSSMQPLAQSHDIFVTLLQLGYDNTKLCHATSHKSMLHYDIK